MPNHFDSILVIKGEEKELTNFIQDFKASAIKGRLCICQMADPIPLILYECKYNNISSLEGQEHYTGRPLTEEEKKEITAFGYYSVGDYTHKWWGLKYGCYDSSLERKSPNEAVFRFWVPLSEVPERIGQILHARYPNLTFNYYGEDECSFDHTFSWEIKNTDPILTREQIDKDWNLLKEKKRLELFRFYKMLGK